MPVIPSPIISEVYHESEVMGDLLMLNESVGSDESEDVVEAIRRQGQDEAAQHQHLQPQVQDGRDREDLGPWLDPVVPGPCHGPLPNDGDGWNRIDLLGVWECGLSSFRTLEEVPTRFREKWAKAMSTIFRRLQQASTVEEEVRALKWFLIAPQAFLREPKRGGRKGRYSLP